jgi:hypothetical protein
VLWGENVDASALTTEPLSAYNPKPSSESKADAKSESKASSDGSSEGKSDAKSDAKSDSKSGLFETLLGADLTYELEALEPLSATIAALLLPGGLAVIAYGRERYATPFFFEVLAQGGWFDVVQQRVPDDEMERLRSDQSISCECDLHGVPRSDCASLFRGDAHDGCCHPQTQRDQA